MTSTQKRDAPTKLKFQQLLAEKKIINNGIPISKEHHSEAREILSYYTRLTPKSHLSPVDIKQLYRTTKSLRYIEVARVLNKVLMLFTDLLNNVTIKSKLENEIAKKLNYTVSKTTVENRINYVKEYFFRLCGLVLRELKNKKEIKKIYDVVNKPLEALFKLRGYVSKYEQKQARSRVGRLYRFFIQMQNAIILVATGIYISFPHTRKDAKARKGIINFSIASGKLRHLMKSLEKKYRDYYKAEHKKFMKKMERMNPSKLRKAIKNAQQKAFEKRRKESTLRANAQPFVPVSEYELPNINPPHQVNNSSKLSNNNAEKAAKGLQPHASVFVPGQAPQVQQQIHANSTGANINERTAQRSMSENKTKFAPLSRVNQQPANTNENTAQRSMSGNKTKFAPLSRVNPPPANPKEQNVFYNAVSVHSQNKQEHKSYNAVSVHPQNEQQHKSNNANTVNGHPQNEQQHKYYNTVSVHPQNEQQHKSNNANTVNGHPQKSNSQGPTKTTKSTKFNFLRTASRIVPYVAGGKKSSKSSSKKKSSKSSSKKKSSKRSSKKK